MSRVSRTNKWLQYGRSLVDLELSSSDSSQLDAIEAAVTLTVEKALVALIYEILELNDGLESEFNLEHLLTLEDEDVSTHWLVKQIKQQRQEPQHWLNQWWSNKKSMSQIETKQGSAKPDSATGRAPNLIAVRNQSAAAGWIDECDQLASDARALNSYD